MIVPLCRRVLVVLLGAVWVTSPVKTRGDLLLLSGALTCKGGERETLPREGGSGLRPEILVLVSTLTAGVGVKRKAVRTTRTLAREDASWSRAGILLVECWWPLTAGVGLEGAVKEAARGPAVRSPSPVTLDIMMGSIGQVRGGRA